MSVDTELAETLAIRLPNRELTATQGVYLTQDTTFRQTAQALGERSEEVLYVCKRVMLFDCDTRYNILWICAVTDNVRVRHPKTRASVIALTVSWNTHHWKRNPNAPTVLLKKKKEDLTQTWKWRRMV